uniref:Mutant chemosensory protein 4 variant n=1 Tax=Bombyx mori TaxID=7091 RepID=H9C8N1_BOMMO|nr:mutant chemosensory protein 4 variant [Bombyx mori]AFF18088.1 mutant chemosensory protein 4 variant [Bombyx mori]AFF18089.1 mutant chemosensory protein 4 variant [Bombyx mori]AFF18090.1 mutant chemosensory protein 4 variant [Bombyx mori]AFF18091.1 mutant chemosensory protein 4 variant [Bombyx mori]
MFMLFIISFIIVPVLKCCGTETSTYTTQYDEVDIKEIMDNERLLVAYIGCLLDKNPCTPEGKELKRNIPDAYKATAINVATSNGRTPTLGLNL